MTVVELVVAASISVMVLAAVAVVVIVTASTTRESTVRAGNTREVRGAAEIITTALRVGVRPAGEPAAVLTAKPDEIAFYALLNRTGAAATAALAPTRVRYFWDPTTKCLTQSRIVGAAVTSPPAGGPFWTWTAAPEVRCVMKTTTAPQFSYYNTAQISVGATPVPSLTAGSSGLAGATLPQVNSVQMLITAQNPTNPDVPGSTVLDRVTLSNAL